MSMRDNVVEAAYNLAKERYGKLGVDTDKVLQRLQEISISLHCWQGDDVGGFEVQDASLSGSGLQATGNYPGKARNVEELRQDLLKALSLIPGRHRVNLHAIYGEFGGRQVDRDQVDVEHFSGWVDWAVANNLKLDMNGSFFAHPMASTGYTLSSKDAEIRHFWIEHAGRCRKIAAYMGNRLGSAAIHNLWVPDGSKDMPADRFSHRRLLKESLDAIYAIKHSDTEMKDSLEGKLFGIGSEAFVVGSHEFYVSYALANGKILCLDTGHFHPTETVTDKISALLQFCEELLLHVSRGVRWDSDHVVILGDDLLAVMQEIVRADALQRVHLALDYFDASINRIGAYVIGTRATLKALLAALLEPTEQLVALEEKNDNFARLALMDELRNMPLGAVWDYYCLQAGVPVGTDWLDEARKYETEVLSGRS